MTGATRRILLSGLLALSLAACAQNKTPIDSAGQPLEELSVVTSSGEHAFWVEIADEEPERQRGLMFREPLADDRGMLFEWPGEPAREQSFWMKNTPSPLDIIYINPQGRIVSIVANATPMSETPLFSYGAANGVLELRAGRAAEIDAKAGDQVRHPYFTP